VVDRNERQTLDAVVGRSPVSDSTQFGPPSVIAKLPTSDLLLYHRRDAAAK